MNMITGYKHYRVEFKSTIKRDAKLSKIVARLDNMLPSHFQSHRQKQILFPYPAACSAKNCVLYSSFMNKNKNWI